MHFLTAMFSANRSSGPTGTRTQNLPLKRRKLSPEGSPIRATGPKIPIRQRPIVDFTTSKVINFAVCGGGWLRSYSSGFSDQRFY